MSVEFTRINKLKRANKNMHMAKQKNELADELGHYVIGKKSVIKKLRRGASIHRDRAAVLRMQSKR